jgi:C-methyltransferase
MTPQPASSAPKPPAAMQLIPMLDGLVLHQLLYAAASLGLADLLENGPLSTDQIARQLNVDESALYRILRALAGKGVFHESAPRTFAHTELSRCLGAEVPGSIWSLIRFRGSDFTYRCFGEILHSVQSGKSARSKLIGPSGWEYMKEHPELAHVFDDAMTNLSALVGPLNAAAYDFGRWGSLMDVGGGNGLFLASILEAHPGLRGVLAEQPHVLERARERSFLGGPLQSRTAMQACDFLAEVPPGCRASVLKAVICDWDDERTHDPRQLQARDSRGRCSAGGRASDFRQKPHRQVRRHRHARIDGRQSAHCRGAS